MNRTVFYCLSNSIGIKISALCGRQPFRQQIWLFWMKCSFNGIKNLSKTEHALFQLFSYLSAQIKLNCMRVLKQAFLFIFGSAAFLYACTKKTDDSIIRKTSLPVSGLQEVPSKTVAGSGTLDVEYNKGTRTLIYKVTWKDLTDTLRQFHIHGTAKKGFNAGIIQNIPILSQTNANGFLPRASGTYSGSVFIDGVVFKEPELLNGEYYINMHTSANPGGEIRGQIEF